MHVLKFALISIMLLTGCTTTAVKFDESKPAQNSRFRTISAEQRFCEVPQQLALFMDASKNLWLNCPYRYEGRTVQHIANIGPKPQSGPDHDIDEVARQKMRTLKKEALRNCGIGKYCADLNQYGYLDFSVQLGEGKARINYVDVSEGLKDLERFYANLDGSSSTVSVDPQLVRLINNTKLVERIDSLNKLVQYQNVYQQLKSLGLTEVAPIRSSLESKRRVLEIADFRKQGGFEGYLSAFHLTGDRSDFEFMQKLAETAEQKSLVFSALIKDYAQSRKADTLHTAERFVSSPKERNELNDLLMVVERERLAELQKREEAKLADLRRQEEAKLTDLRQQEEAKLASQRAQQVRADEERCMRDTTCRHAVEQRRAMCTQKVRTCQQACDRVVGAGTYGSFFADLTAAAMARTCYAGCKCDSGFGDLLAKFNHASSESTTAVASSKAPQHDSKPKVYECKIYCKSATGPTTYKRIEASSRQGAAKIASDRASEFCEQNGQSYASSIKFSESQCQEK